MRKRPLAPLPNRLAGPMEIHVMPKRDFSKSEQFDPIQLAGKEYGFEMFHRSCGGRVELNLKEHVQRLLLFPVSSKYYYRFVCTACQKTYEVELTGRHDLADECSFTMQCLRRVLVEKQGPCGSPLRLEFHYREF